MNYFVCKKFDVRYNIYIKGQALYATYIHMEIHMSNLVRVLEEHRYSSGMYRFTYRNGLGEMTDDEKLEEVLKEFFRDNKKFIKKYRCEKVVLRDQCIAQIKKGDEVVEELRWNFALVEFGKKQ